MACYTLGVLINIDDLNDATGNTDTNKNLKMYVDYTDCSGSAKTIYFTFETSDIVFSYNNICINWNEDVTIYYYKNNAVQYPGNSYVTDSNTCTESVETSISFSCVNVNGLRAYNVSDGHYSPNECLGNDGPFPNVIYGDNPNAWEDCTRFFEDAFGQTIFNGGDYYYGEENQTGITLCISSYSYVIDKQTGC